VLWRDNYTCQHCGAKEDLNAHHILGKMDGGTDTPKNGITLCKKCHDSIHAGEWVLEKKAITFKYPMHLMQGNLPKRTKVWEDNPTKKSKEKLGFRHYDLVKAKHRTKGWVIGSVRSLKEKVITLRTKFDDNFPVSYRKSILLFRFNRIVYSY